LDNPASTIKAGGARFAFTSIRANYLWCDRDRISPESIDRDFIAKGKGTVVGTDEKPKPGDRAQMLRQIEHDMRNCLYSLEAGIRLMKQTVSEEQMVSLAEMLHDAQQRAANLFEQYRREAENLPHDE
jgi:hypothetical protein